MTPRKAGHVNTRKRDRLGGKIRGGTAYHACGEDDHLCECVDAAMSDEMFAVPSKDGALLAFTTIALLLLLFPHEGASSARLDSLTSCLSQNGILNFTTRASNGSEFTHLLDFSIQNLRFEGAVPQPDALIFPTTPHEVQRAFMCCCSPDAMANNKWVLRVRSGGHSYEGLSYTADAPFVVLDLMNMRSIHVDVESQTAWVQGGATLGELYYAISQASPLHSFPAGTCPTIGVGGHLSGGGYGILSRKYGVAADNVIDAQIVDARGHLMDRSTMGEDLFWALRGGGGGSWGIVVAWRVKLVHVTPNVTSFSLPTLTGKASIVGVLERWQTAASSAPDELYNSMFIAGVGEQNQKPATVQASFSGVYLGNVSATLTVLNRLYGGLLNFTSADCNELTWIQEVAAAAGVTDPAALQSRQSQGKNYFKAKSDYVRGAIPNHGLAGALDILMQNPNGYIILDPYGGVLGRISSDAIAFPHRAGNLYSIQYQVSWDGSDDGAPAALSWLRKLHAYMGSYVSRDPRAAYVNYIDLDLGNASIAGHSYFLHNFPRLAHIKGQVDPHNIFNNPQSIPSTASRSLHPH